MTPDCHVGGQLVGGRGGHRSSGALPPATDLIVNSPGAMTAPVAGPSPADLSSLGGSMVDGTDSTAAVPSTVAHRPVTQLFTVPGRASRPQAVPPRPGVRESVLATIHQLVVEIADVAIDEPEALDLAAMDGGELVALGERLGATYGPEVDVIGWFGELDIDDLAELTAGDVVDYVVWCLAS